ncbi:hypothetical protein, partial [Pseudomonas sp. GP01-A14]|uniref:hypothetical protein n=1 Tax=Pseudomonas sp. GP01-A14 TaxID=2070567 RepID=UPI001C4508D3
MSRSLLLFMPVYQVGADTQSDTQPKKPRQTTAVLFGIPNDTIRNIRLSEHPPSPAFDDLKNPHKFHTVVVIFVTCQLAYILLH